jgi:hypothetical protein
MSEAEPFMALKEQSEPDLQLMRLKEFRFRTFLQSDSGLP